MNDVKEIEDKKDELKYLVGRMEDDGVDYHLRRGFEGWMILRSLILVRKIYGGV